MFNENIGDPYSDAGKFKMRAAKKDGHIAAGHDANFKPAKTVHQKVEALFPHMTDHKEVNKCRKGPDGAVIVEPKNFLTSPMKKGKVGKNTFLGGIIEYKEDPFERKRELERKELEEHHKKM